MFLSFHLPLQSVTLHTNLGDVKIELHCEEVPRTAENFLALAASGAYDGTAFHRNIKGFMIQVSANAHGSLAWVLEQFVVLP